VGRFFAGFVVATVLWAAVAGAAYWTGMVAPVLEQVTDAGAPADAAPEPEAREERRRKGRRWRKGRRGRGRGRARSKAPTGDAVTGDDIDDQGPREVDLGDEGGEQQLSSAEIDRAFGSAMGRVRRCALLAHEDADLRGRVVFGLRIRGNGRVAGVNLSGPAALTTGEAGGCMRAAARRVTFPTFDGPDMVVRYPVTFE
jgi:hypothetical protein